MTRFIYGFTAGFFAPLTGFRRLLSDSRLRALAIIPLLISLILGSFLTVTGIWWVATSIGAVSLELTSILGFDPSGYAPIVILIFLWPMALLVLGVAVYVSVRLVAAPFYSYLAEKTLVKLGTRHDTPFRAHEWVWLSLRMLLVSLLKSVLFCIAGVVLFVFSLVPILNIVAAIGFMHMIAFDISDYSFEAMEWPLARRIRHVRSHFVTYSGLAFGLGLLMMIPGLSLVLLPAAVVGASETLHRTLSRSGDSSAEELA
ncbi:hypothetical protein BH10BDE1_BH10BDE1_20470 [soil metagenome]